LDNANSPVDGGPLVTVGDHASADWVQGTRRGRALLRHSSGQRRVAEKVDEMMQSAELLALVATFNRALSRIDIAWKAQRFFLSMRRKKFEHRRMTRNNLVRGYIEK
jgi:hypothetical protein